jgi:hypothetical protein
VWLRTLVTFSLLLGATAGNASKVNEVIVQIKEGPSSQEPVRFEVAEADLNAWVSVVVQSQPRLGVSDTTIWLVAQDRVRARALVDMDQVELEGFSVQLFRTVLQGTQELVLEGTLSCRDGRGRYATESAQFNGVTVPAWLVDQIIAYLGRRHGGVDVTESFDLPYGIRAVQIEPRRLIILR